MKSLLRTLVASATTLSTLAWSHVFADTASLENCGILAGATSSDEKCKDKLRNGNLNFEDIPNIIQTATSILLGFTGTISMIMIIIGGFKYALGSIEGDKTKGKDTIIYGISGFVVSAAAWFIIKLVLDNL